MLQLKLKQSNDLLIVFNEKLNILPPKQLEYFQGYKETISFLIRIIIYLDRSWKKLKLNVASQVGKVQIVDYARTPGNSGINKNRIVLSGLIFGLIIGVSLIFIVELLDNTIKTNYDIERNSLAVLGVIPSIGEEVSKKKIKLYGNI